MSPYLDVSTRLICVWLVCSVTATLLPFNFAVPPPDRLPEFTGFSEGSHQQDPMHLVLNMLLFAPFGALVHHGRQRHAVNLPTIVLMTGTAACLISFGIEWLQHLLPGRESSLVDVAANTGGAVLGVFANRVAGGAAIAGPISKLRASESPRTLLVALLGVMVVSLALSGTFQALARLSNWSPEYPLLIGNEGTGDRPWRGKVFSLEITDAATPLSVVRRFAAGESVPLRGASIARFSFTGSAPYRDAAGGVAELDWTPDPSESDPLTGTVAMTGRPWLQSRVPPSRLVRRLGETNAFTLRIRCASGDQTQSGPARIVSNSVNPSLRNFTVGQRGSDLVVRLRTPLTGLNGSPPETVVPEVFTSDQPRDIVITYDGTSLVAAVAPSNQIVRVELSPGLNAALALGPNTLEVPKRQQIYKLTYLGVLFLAPAALIGLSGRRRRERIMLSAIYLFSSAIALEAMLVLASGRAFDLGNACVTVAAGSVVLVIVGVTLAVGNLRRPDLENTGRFRRPLG